MTHEWDHPTMTREQFDARVRELYEEGGTDLGWWHLSFATDEEFVGGLYLRAWHGIDAVRRSHVLGLNPAGRGIACSVMTTGPISDALMDEHVPAENRYRLLSREEQEAEG